VRQGDPRCDQTDILDGLVAWIVEVLARICLNGSLPNLHVPGQVVSFLIRHLGPLFRLRRPWSGSGCDCGGRSLGSPGQGHSGDLLSRRRRWWMCSGPSRPPVVQRASDLIPDQKFDELFAPFGLYRDRLWWRLGCRPGAGIEVLGVTCGDADVGQQLITAAAPHFLGRVRVATPLPAADAGF
jgi:hypothetical protein